MNGSRRLAILAEGMLDFHHGKTATSLLRYRPDDVVALIDSDHAGRTAEQVLGIGGEIPIVETFDDTLRYEPSALLIGIAPRGGALPPAWRRQIVSAIERGLDVISGLHYMLNDDTEFAEAAQSRGVSLVDVRQPPSDLGVASLRPRRAGAYVITFVGSDCAVGKMTAALETTADARARGLSTSFVATGQTGIMLDGRGIAIDRVIGDFMAGAAERLVLEATQDSDLVFVEGQGSLLHPGYSGVTLALLHGSSPDAMILVHQADQQFVDCYDLVIPPLDALVTTYEQAAAWVKPAPVVAISLTTRSMDDDQSRDAIEAAHELTGLPVTDPVRYGAGTLVDAVLRARDRT
ncbi:MAG: DUF1611 domain-containing protein [Chloroflexota bacterium]